MSGCQTVCTKPLCVLYLAHKIRIALLYDVGATARSRKLDSALEQKAKRNGLSNTEIANIKRQVKLEAWQKGVNEMVGYVAEGEIIRDRKRRVAQVGELKPNIIKALTKIGKKPEHTSVAIYWSTINHMLRNTKPEAKKPTLAEVKQMVKVLDEARHCFYDSINKNIVYYSPSQEKDRILSVSVNLDFLLKKFNTDNYIATISKVPKQAYKSILGNNEVHIRLK